MPPPTEQEQLALDRELTKRAEFVEAEINDAIGAALASAKGRRFLWWLLQIGRVGTQPFNLNPTATAFNCGELNVGNQILDRIVAVRPEGYVTMQQEHLDEHNRFSARNPTDDDADSGTALEYPAAAV